MKTVVMTGGTAGLGEVAAQQISRSPNTRLIIGARASYAPTEITVLPLDLARLASVRTFADAVLDRLNGAGIDALVLNPARNSRTSTSARKMASRRPSRSTISHTTCCCAYYFRNLPSMLAWLSQRAIRTIRRRIRSRRRCTPMRNGWPIRVMKPNGDSWPDFALIQPRSCAIC